MRGESPDQDYIPGTIPRGKMMKLRYVYRSAITGHFVSEKYAKCHKRTTVRERIGLARKLSTWRRRVNLKVRPRKEK